MLYMQFSLIVPIMIFLQFDLTSERFYNIRVVLLLVYVLTTANGHNQPGYKVFYLVWFELYFVWSLPSDL